MSFELSDLKENNSDLLNLLTQHLPDMLWVKDINGDYIYANQTICDTLLMAKDTKEPIGKGDVFFALREREAHKDKPDWHTFGELCFNSDQTVIDKNEAMRFEEYGNVKGKLFYLEVYKAPFYDKNGKIIGTVGAGRDITKLKKIQLDLEKSLKILEEQRTQLEYQEHHDSLTSLPNRILFLDRLGQSIEQAKRDSKEVAVVFVDLDNFKEINDSMGHNFGDKVLVEVSKKIQTRMRGSDTLARLGGDEFCIILNNIDNADDISDFMATFMETLKEPLNINNNTLYIGMSVGISIYPYDGKDAHTLFKNADAAMYKAKKSGRDTYAFYDEAMTKKSLERVTLETSLREALKKDEFVVYYQPQMDASKNKLVGMEALVRWEHPTLGLIPPNKFIPLAEDTGMIIELDRIVMKKAISQLLQWYEDGLNPGKLALNLAIKQIEEKDFIEFITGLISSNHSLSKYVELEVTESQIMNNPDKSIARLKELSDLGISIAIDDFGTGYSSLSYLKKLPINKLKIDKSFVDNMVTDAEDGAICKTIISLCKNLNLKVIAEGVEDEAQKEFLVENGCKFIQGYFYAKPMPASEMRKFLTK